MKGNKPLEDEIRNCIVPDQDNKTGRIFGAMINSELIKLESKKINEILSNKAPRPGQFRRLDPSIKNHLSLFLRKFVNSCAENVFYQIIKNAYLTIDSLTSTDTKTIVNDLMEDINVEFFGGRHQVELLKQCAIGLNDKYRRNLHESYLSESDYSNNQLYIKTLLGYEISTIKERLGVRNFHEVTYYKQQVSEKRTKKAKSRETNRPAAANSGIKDGDAKEDGASSDVSWRYRIPKTLPPHKTVSDLFHPRMK